MIADLAYELWQRATAAAAVELKGGPTARQVIARMEEAQAVRAQLAGLRDQMQRDALSYGELRAQSARHEAIAAGALAQVRDASARERDLLRDLGAANQRISELEATIVQLRTSVTTSPAASRRRNPGKRVRPIPKRSRQRLVNRRSGAAKQKRSRRVPKPRPPPSPKRRRKGPRR